MVTCVIARALRAADRVDPGSNGAMKSNDLPTAGGCGGGCSRRELLRTLGVAGASALLLGACAQPGSDLPGAATSTCGGGTCIDLADPVNQALATVGGALLIDTASDTIMVIRTSDTAVIALSAICTHSGCSMNFVPASRLLDCPCHGSQFSEDGQVVKGPARKALKLYTATLASNVITIAA
jgi:nitrite reductase/ring-hydroxylating ferredoxin subunit